MAVDIREMASGAALGPYEYDVVYPDEAAAAVRAIAARKRAKQEMTGQASDGMYTRGLLGMLYSGEDVAGQLCGYGFSYGPSDYFEGTGIEFGDPEMYNTGELGGLFSFIGKAAKKIAKGVGSVLKTGVSIATGGGGGGGGQTIVYQPPTFTPPVLTAQPGSGGPGASPASGSLFPAELPKWLLPVGLGIGGLILLKTLTSK
jgi:hypothetical protein